MTINEIQDEIIDEFSGFDDWMDKYQLLIDLGNEQEPLDEKYKTESNLIDGCQSRVWLQCDYVDGKLARKNNQVTNFGKFMDPVADKLLVMAALLIFVEDGTIPAWAVAIILGREFIVSALRMVAASSGLVIAANIWGKAKTMITMITLIFLLCPIGPVCLGPVSLQDVMVWITVIITAISGATYIVDNFAVIKDGFTQKGA